MSTDTYTLSAERCLLTPEHSIHAALQSLSPQPAPQLKVWIKSCIWQKLKSWLASLSRSGWKGSRRHSGGWALASDHLSLLQGLWFRGSNIRLKAEGLVETKGGQTPLPPSPQGTWEATICVHLGF